jgi:hypothetical protein
MTDVSIPSGTAPSLVTLAPDQLSISPPLSDMIVER